MGLLEKPPFPKEMYKEMPRAPLNMISRQEWGAAAATSEEKFDELPVKNVSMGYTETEPCTTKEECIQLMQDLQKKHMSEGMSDIRYNFVVGADSNIYEGRGWTKKPGTHPKYPELNGDNLDMVHTSLKGDLPIDYLSAIMWNLVDQGTYAGYVEEFAKFYQDFEFPSPSPGLVEDAIPEGWTCGGVLPDNTTPNYDNTNQKQLFD